jgi:phenylacetate-coenzyme A ligase PaaK-like adenylate-forming protein
MPQLIRLSVLVHRLRYASHWPPEKIKELQESRLRELLAHAQKNSPFYARRFKGIDVATCKLSDLPTTNKPEMMANLEDVVTDRRIRKADIEQFTADPSNLGKPYLGRYAVGHTSGSQGQPALIVQDVEGMRLAFAVQVARGSAIKRKFLPQLRRLFNPARLALFTQKPGFYPSGAAFSYLPRAALPFFKVMRLSVFDPIDEVVAKLNKFRPHVLTGFTSSLEILAREEEAGRLNLRQANCLEQITNFSEPLPESARRRLEGTFGVHIFDQYAMGECLALSSGCTQFSGSHLNADLAILEVVDENYRPVPAGQQGKKVLLTNLYNHVQPFIRYELDDRVTMSPGPCTCGNTMPYIQSVQGRTKDGFWIEVDGQYREFPYYIFLQGISPNLDIAEHQVLQTGVNTFVVRVTPQQGKTLSAERTRRLVEEAVGLEGLSGVLKVEVEIVDHIDRGPSGKAERVRNLFGPPPKQLVS